MHSAVSSDYMASSRSIKNPVLNIKVDTSLETMLGVEFFPCVCAKMCVCVCVHKHMNMHNKYHIYCLKEEPRTNTPCIPLYDFSSSLNSVCSVPRAGYMFFQRLNSHRIPIEDGVCRV